VEGRTTLMLLVQTTSKEERDAIMSSGMEVGMQEQLELLEQVASSLG
jgi:enolase